MSGLEKIVERISRESAEKAEGILNEAKARAESIGRDSERKTREECEAIAKKAEEQASTILDRGRASADLRQKQILLSGKQEVLNDTIGKAKEQLESLPDGEYIEFFTELFKKHISGQDAVLKINAADKLRLSGGTLDALKAAAGEAGCNLTVSDEDACIKNGFILDYGGVEENCTFDALFDQNIEDLQDKVKSILFA